MLVDRWLGSAGGTTRYLDVPIGKVPVHVLGGNILAMQQASNLTSTTRTSDITLLVALPGAAPGGSAEGTPAQAQPGMKPDSGIINEHYGPEVGADSIASSAGRRLQSDR